MTPPSNSPQTGLPEKEPGPSFKDIARALIGKTDIRAELCQAAYKGQGLG
jgi:cytochrome c551/c552